MKQKLLFAIFACCLFVQNTYSQTGYIYVHLKHVNEEASPNYSYTLKNSSGTTVKTFNLNDQPSADNATSGSYVYVYDIGESHGTGGDGQLWVVGGTSWGSLQASNTLTALSGTIYYRNEGSSVWASAGISSARSIDGAYANQCVYTTTSGNVVFYNNGSTSTIYTGTDAWDVTANGGKIAITTTAGAIKVYANAYTTSAAPATGGTWNTVTSPNAITQLDMNLSGSKIVYLTYNTTTPKTVTAATSGTQTPTSLASFSSLASASGAWDIAYDDSDYVYFSATSSTAGITSIYSSTTTSATAWNYESRSGDVTGVTAGAARSVFAVQTQLTSPADETIFSRFTDQTGTVYWVDDDRVKNTSSVYGNGIMIAISPGTYTLTETLPSSSYDLGRVNVYDPRGNTTYSVNTQTITYVVAQNVVVCGEYVNEKLNPKAIALTCSFQYLQTFDASNSSPLYGTTTFGSGTYGTNVEGTSYHYWNQATAHDGYYFLIKNETGSQWFTNDGIVDHTGNGGYFLLVNASFQVDEFYRQRVTNLVPGLSYSITFYAANASPSATTLYPNITFGLQDTSGAYLSPTTTGNITSATWTKYTLTFTATTSTADLFLSNNGIGGNGNDIAIDDIAINPVITPLPTITVTPVIAPNVCIGTTYTFGNSQSGGVWTTSPSTVATVINASTGKIKGIAAGNATVTYSYTNAIGCTSTTSTGIIVSPKPTVTTSDLLGGTSCLNQTDSLFSTVSSGTTPYTYAWTELSGTGTGGLGTSNIPNTIAAPTASGSYTYLMTVTDAVGCAGTSSVTLSVSANTAPTVTAGISSSPYCTSSAINLSSSATGGSGSYTYTWSASPTGNGLGTTNTQNTTATPTAAGTYAYKIVVNDGFCNVPKTVSATVNSTPSVTVSAPTGTQILCSNASYAITSTPSGGSGTYTYAWSASKVSGLDNGPGLQSPTNTQNVTAKPTLTLSTALVPDVYKYSLTITDGNGCTAAGSANVTAYLNALAAAPTVSISAPSSANTICLGSTVTLTGSASGGSTPYTYSWTGPNSYTAAVLSPGAITPSAAGTGTYTLTVTGNNGCKASATSPAITVNPAPSVVVSRFAAKLCANTVDSVYATASGGTAPYTYLWTSSSNSGGFNISQTTNDTTAVTGGNSGTAYTLTMTVTDAGPTTHCTATANTTITKSSSNGPSLSVTPSSNGTICINSATTLTGTASSGTSPYTYAWTATGSGNTFSAATAASTTVTPSVAGSYLYTLKVTDNNGCAIQKSTGTQTVNSPLVVTTTADAPGFCGANGSVNLVASPSGGSGTYNSYVWTTAVKVSPGSTTVSPTSSTTTGVTTATISGATVGTSRFQYFAVVTDNAGCTGSDSSDILVVGSTPTFSATPTATISSACVGQTFNLSSAAFSGGTPSYNYSWTAPTGVTVATASGTASSSPIPATTAPANVAGNYNFGLLVVDGNNCKVTASIAASTINPVPVITLASDDYSVCKAPATTINLTGTFTTATASPYTYAWTGSGVVNNTSSNVTTAVPTTSGTYGVTVTDGNGCTGNATSSTVTALSSPVITASADKTVACATPATTINLTGSLTTGTTSPYTYSWAGNGVIAANSLTTNATPTAAGSYTITVTDANGCTATGTTTNVSYDALIASVTFGNCGTNSAGVKYGQLSETNGSTWLWTTIDGGRFYKTNALSVTTDSAISHLQAPYVTFLGTYSVAITDGNNCTASGSVTVTSSSCSIILAVSNLSFSAQKQGNTVLLDWRTTTEINNDHFDVERSSDGTSWQVIGTVKGHGNSTTPIQYSYADALPLNGTNYYRLKQTDADAKYTYSTVKTVQFTGQWLVKLYPNPVKGFMVLEFNNDRDEKGAIVIQTMAGSTIFAIEKQLVKGLNRITLNQVQPLAQGTYMVTLGTLNNIFRSKFVKAGN